MDSRLLDCNEKFEILLFWSWFRSFFHEHFELVHAEHAQNKKMSYGCRWTHVEVNKMIFLKSLLFRYFLLVLKIWKVLAFLPQAQHAE